MSEHFDPYYVWLGIPPEESTGGGQNHYRLLGLRLFESNADVISNAVDQRRTFLRTMQSGKRGPQSQQLLNEVSAAGVCLLNAEKKARYDEELRQKLAAAAPAAVPVAAPSPPPLPSSAHERPVAGPAATNAVIAVKPRRKAKGTSTAAIAALVVSCATALGIVAAGIAWWAFQRRSESEAVAAVPADNGAPSDAREPAPLPQPGPQQSSTASVEKSLDTQPAQTQTLAPAPTPAPSVSSPQPQPSSNTSSVARPADPSPPEPQPQPPPQPNPLLVGRPHPPSGEALATAMEEARKIYEADFKTATKAPQKAALARKILETAKATQGDATARYVLIDLARKVFAQAGEVGEALGAARLIENDYEMPRDEMAVATLELLEAAPQTPEQRADLAKTAADMADSSVGAEEFERADKLAAMAWAAAQKQKDNDLKREINQRKTQIGNLVKDWNTAKRSLEKLKDDPADAAANLAVGKFYCFALEDFRRGIPYLLAGSDSQLAEAAKLDAAAQAEGPARRLEAATAWQQVAAKISDRDDKQALQRRERWLLQQAVSGLSGLDQIKAQKRLDDLKDIGQGRAAIAAASSSRTAMPKRNVAMMGRLVVGTKDAGIVVTYDQGYSITKDDVGRILSAANINNAQNLKLGLVGGFVLAADQPVVFHHSGNTDASGAHRVYIDNRPIVTIGPNSSRNSSYTTRLRAGLHVVRWELSGDDLGTAMLELRGDPMTSGGSSAPIPMSVDRSVEQAARQLPTKATVHLGSR